ncbi:MAG: 4Fe-4S binding protein [Chloroflexi bacterium]|nr:4Fe-4S binding protein [Chloroflexota bacterium]MCL5074747.1 4Fe-4S binding protein [Chloroflexota bacterium]
MPQAIIDPARCRPEQCYGGICFIKRTCPTRAIYQEEPYAPPTTDPLRCHGCSKCIAHCPLKAIRLA